MPGKNWKRKAKSLKRKTKALSAEIAALESELEEAWRIAGDEDADPLYEASLLLVRAAAARRVLDDEGSLRAVASAAGCSVEFAREVVMDDVAALEGFRRESARLGIELGEVAEAGASVRPDSDEALDGGRPAVAESAAGLVLDALALSELAEGRPVEECKDARNVPEAEALVPGGSERAASEFRRADDWLRAFCGLSLEQARLVGLHASDPSMPQSWVAARIGATPRRVRSMVDSLWLSWKRGPKRPTSPKGKRGSGEQHPSQPAS